MQEDELAADVARESAKLVPMVYQDAAQPAIREVGSTLGGLVRVALSPANLLI